MLKKSLIGLAIWSVLGISIIQAQDRPEQPDVPGDISIDFGLGLMSNNPNYFDNDLWPSRALGLHYMYTLKISDRFLFNPAIGFGFDRLGLQNNVNFVKDPTASVYAIDTIADLTLKKNMLTYAYFELPLEIRYYPFRTVKGEGFFIGAGTILGVRMRSETKIKYEVEEEKFVERDRANFGLSDFRYGIQAHIGWKPFSIFYKHYFNDLFQQGPDDLTPRQFTIGINFTGF
jgi:hypothetical protein